MSENRFAGSFLSARPSEPNLKLKDFELALAIKLRLGITTSPKNINMTHCICGQKLTSHPHHILSCKKIWHLNIARHDLVVRRLGNLLADLGHKVIFEPNKVKQNQHSLLNLIFLLQAEKIHMRLMSPQSIPLPKAC